MEQRDAAIEVLLHRRRARRRQMHRAQPAGRRAVIMLVRLLSRGCRTKGRHRDGQRQHTDQEDSRHVLRLHIVSDDTAGRPEQSG